MTLLSSDFQVSCVWQHKGTWRQLKGPLWVKREERYVPGHALTCAMARL